MHRPPICRTHAPLRTTIVIVSLLFGGCTGESSAPAPLSGQTKSWSEGDGQRSDSQGARVKSSNIKTH
jgi:hypothetical protein